MPFRTQGIASSERSGCRIVRPPKEGNPDYAGLRTRPHGVLHASRAQAGATGLSQEEVVTGPQQPPSSSLARQREPRTTSVRRPLPTPGNGEPHASQTDESAVWVSAGCPKAGARRSKSSLRSHWHFAATAASSRECQSEGHLGCPIPKPGLGHSWALQLGPSRLHQWHEPREQEPPRSPPPREAARLTRLQ